MVFYVQSDFVSQYHNIICTTELTFLLLMTFRKLSLRDFLCMEYSETFHRGKSVQDDTMSVRFYKGYLCLPL